MPNPSWSFYADTGGTFTDFLAEDPHGDWRRAKVLSTGRIRGAAIESPSPTRLRVRLAADAPDGFFAGWMLRPLASGSTAVRVSGSDGQAGHLDLEAPPGLDPPFGFDLDAGLEAPIAAARLATGTPLGEPLPPHRLRLATTRGTNALLERTGAPPLFVVNRGFGDLLDIGDQTRPDLFALRIVRPAPLAGAVLEIDGRLDAEGREIEPLDEDEIRQGARRLRAQGFSTTAIALLHAYRNPAHEQRVAELLAAEGFEHLSVSSAIAPLIRLLPRAQTVVVNAYLAPVVGRYLDGVRAQGGTACGGIRVMTSAGGLVDASAFQAKDSLLSGPAGGVAGAAAAGRRLGIERLIAFDMGGTSTDVSRFDGDFAYDFEHEVGGAVLQAPALRIASVAAGGGSVCWWDGARLGVGPKSCGASPGPACYGAGGPLAVTDANVLLGRAPDWAFDFPVDRDAAQARLADLLDRMEQDGSPVESPEALLEGFLRIANEAMAAAIRGVSLREGYDPADYALAAFGGAGGQHACELAGMLGIRTVLSPADASLLSAVGLRAAAVERHAARQVLRPWQDAAAEVPALVAGMAGEAAEDLGEEVAGQRVLLEMRFAGQEFSLQVEWSPEADCADLFRRRHEEIYGFVPDGRAVELVSARVVVRGRPGSPPVAAREDGPARDWPDSAEVWLGGGRARIPVAARDRLALGEGIDGPALVVDLTTTLYLPPGWRAECRGGGDLVATRPAAADDSVPEG